MDFASVANSADRVAFNFAFDKGSARETAQLRKTKRILPIALTLIPR
jgi:hypothetical protein